jgi:hypothetical protein
VQTATAVDSPSAAMIIHVSDPSLVPELLEYLTRNPDVIAARAGDGEIEVSLLGSRRQPWNRMELTLRVRAWQAARENVVVEIHA